MFILRTTFLNVAFGASFYGADLTDMLEAGIAPLTPDATTPQNDTLGENQQHDTGQLISNSGFV